MANTFQKGRAREACLTSWVQPFLDLDSSKVFLNSKRVYLYKLYLEQKYCV